MVIDTCNAPAAIQWCVFECILHSGKPLSRLGTRQRADAAIIKHCDVASVIVMLVLHVNNAFVQGWPLSREPPSPPSPVAKGDPMGEAMSPRPRDRAYMSLHTSAAVEPKTAAHLHTVEHCVPQQQPAPQVVSVQAVVAAAWFSCLLGST